MRDIDSSCRFGALLQVPHFDLVCFVFQNYLAVVVSCRPKEGSYNEIFKSNYIEPSLSISRATILDTLNLRVYTGDQISLLSQIKCLTA